MHQGNLLGVYPYFFDILPPPPRQSYSVYFQVKRSVFHLIREIKDSRCQDKWTALPSPGQMDSLTVFRTLGGSIFQNTICSFLEYFCYWIESIVIIPRLCAFCHWSFINCVQHAVYFQFSTESYYSLSVP